MTAYADMTPHEKQAYTIETRRLATRIVYIKPGSHERAIACLALCERYQNEAAGIMQAKLNRTHAKQADARARNRRRLETVCDPLDHDHSMNG